VKGTLIGIAAVCIPALSLWSGDVRQQPIFTSTTVAVPLYVTVLSGDDRYPTDLAARDFTVLEDGRVRPITQFESGTQPLALSVLVDESPSASDARARTEAAAREVVRGLRLGDVACIGAFSQSVSLPAGLTGDPTALMHRVHALAPGAAGTALWDALDAGIEAVDHEGGHRVVVVLTDGVDTRSFRNATFVRDRITKSGVTLYVIGVEGKVIGPVSDKERLCHRNSHFIRAIDYRRGIGPVGAGRERHVTEETRLSPQVGSTTEAIRQ